VTQAIPGGFTVTVTTTPSSECPKIREDIASLQEDLKTETDPITRRQIIQQLAILRAKAKQLSCP